MKKNIIIILLAIISIGLIGYIIYDKNDNDTVNKVNYKLIDFTKVINNELYFLVSQKNYKDLTDKEKTYMFYLLVDDRNNVTVDKLENIRKNSSLRELSVNYTDIYDSYNGYELTNDILRSLNKETGQYSEPLIGHGGLFIDKIPFLVDYKFENNRYIISYKYVFTKNQGDGPTNLDAYYTYEDAIKGQNKIKEFLLEDANDESSLLFQNVKDYANENYDDLKDKLDTYNYVFEVKDNNIILTDFYRE